MAFSVANDSARTDLFLRDPVVPREINARTMHLWMRSRDTTLPLCPLLHGGCAVPDGDS